jgi:hypothetical protein
MIRPGESVLLDTTAIIEAHRQGVWEPLVNGFRLATVEKCIEEVDTGNLLAGERREIDTGRLRREMMVYQVDDTTIAEAVLSSEGKLQILHAGEKELLAYAISVSGILRISSQDRACVRVGAKMGLLDRFVSLEEMAEAVGRKRLPLPWQYTKKWLSEIRTACRLEEL